MMTKSIKGTTLGATLFATLFVAGCGTQAKRVDCEWRLQPINRPAKVKESNSPKTPTPAPDTGTRNPEASDKATGAGKR